MSKIISNLSFKLVGSLQLARSVKGQPVEYAYCLGAEIVPNRFATGPFCDFELVEASSDSGIYALIVDDDIMYVGECKNLKGRFGPLGYGHISSRNCHSDGQTTNCKINSFVLQVSRTQNNVQVWFSPIPAEVKRKSVEAVLIRNENPPWNGSRPLWRCGGAGPSSSALPGGSLEPRDRFELALLRELAIAQRSGLSALRVRAGDLHRRVGGYPRPSHRMPLCCRAMKEHMEEGDVIIERPPSGLGANFVIEYKLPRQTDS